MTIMSRLRSLSTLTSRALLAGAAGMTFGDKRDVNKVLGYKPTISLEHYRYRYRRDPIAQRIIEAMPQATWRGDVDLVEDKDPKIVTKFEQEFIDLDKRLRIWDNFEKVDVLAGLGEFAVLLIGGPGSFESELVSVASPDEIQYLTPFGQADVTVLDRVVDPRDPRFGDPLMYNFRRLNPDSKRQTKVHWSRVLHVAEGELDERGVGKPRLESVWNRLDDLEKVTGGGSEAFWMRANRGLQFDVDPEIDLQPEGEADLQQEAEEYQHEIRRIIRTRGVTIKDLGSEVADFSPAADAIISQISAGTGIPRRILMGSEMGSLASTQDRNNINERVKARQARFAKPVIVEPFVDRMIKIKALSEPKQFTPVWGAMVHLEESEKADVASKWASVNQKMGEVVVIPDEIRDQVLGLPKLETVIPKAELDAKNERLKPTPVDPAQDPNQRGNQDPTRGPKPVTTAA